MKQFSALLILPLLTLFFSCAARIDGTIREGGSAEVSFQTSLEPRIIALIQSLRSFMGETPSTPILDGPAMGYSLASSPGISSVSIRNTSGTSLEGIIYISNIGDFLASPAGKGRFITYVEGRTPGSSSLIITLDKDTTPELISRLSPEAVEYLEALFAPAVLGETSTKAEYLSLVSMIYGRAMADEITAARIRASVEFPRSVSSTHGGAASGRRVDFNIPLVDLLVLETPLRYEVIW